MPISDLYNQGGDRLSKIVKPISSFFKTPKVEASLAPTPAPVQYNLKDRGVQISDDDINSFKPLLYGEVSNRTPDKQALEANVILNTALNRVREYGNKGQKKSLSEVLSMPNQYQAYGGKQYQAYHNPPDEVAAAKKRQVDLIVENIRNQIKSGKYPDNTQGAYYYVHNPDSTITYDNLRPLFAK